jgi:hypothetical protein
VAGGSEAAGCRELARAQSLARLKQAPAEFLVEVRARVAARGGGQLLVQGLAALTDEQLWALDPEDLLALGARGAGPAPGLRRGRCHGRLAWLLLLSQPLLAQACPAALSGCCCCCC